MTKRYELWAWVETDELGRQGIVTTPVAAGPAVRPPMMLMSTDLAITEALQPTAKEYSEYVGRPVRLVHLLEVHF